MFSSTFNDQPLNLYCYINIDRNEFYIDQNTILVDSFVAGRDLVYEVVYSATGLLTIPLICIYL